MTGNEIHVGITSPFASVIGELQITGALDQLTIPQSDSINYFSVCDEPATPRAIIKYDKDAVELFAMENGSTVLIYLPEVARSMGMLRDKAQLESDERVSWDERVGAIMERGKNGNVTCMPIVLAEKTHAAEQHPHFIRKVRVMSDDGATLIDSIAFLTSITKILENGTITVNGQPLPTSYQEVSFRCGSCGDD